MSQTSQMIPATLHQMAVRTTQEMTLLMTSQQMQMTPRPAPDRPGMILLLMTSQ